MARVTRRPRSSEPVERVDEITRRGEGALHTQCQRLDRAGVDDELTIDKELDQQRPQQRIVGRSDLGLRRQAQAREQVRHLQAPLSRLGPRRQ